MVKLGGIQDILKGKAAQPTTVEEPEEPQEIIPDGPVEIDQQKTEELLLAFSKIMENEGQRNMSVWFKEPEWKPTDNGIVLLGTAANLSLLEEVKTQLAGYLSQNLNHPVLVSLEKIQKQDRKRKAYTDREIFKEMVQQNPNLQDLKDDLDLDFDSI